MSFEFNVITDAGKALVAQATATNQIVFIGSLSSATAASSLADLASKDVSFYNGQSGSVFSCSATDNIARIIMNFDNTGLEAQQTIKSACILGRLASQQDSEAVIVAAISDNNSQIIIPDSTAPKANIHIVINVAVEADNQVETVGAQYASLADLERFVSLYKAGDPTAGERQTVNGFKIFTSGIGVNDCVQILSGSNAFIDATNTGFEYGISGNADTEVIFADETVRLIDGGFFFLNFDEDTISNFKVKDQMVFGEDEDSYLFKSTTIEELDFSDSLHNFGAKLVCGIKYYDEGETIAKFGDFRVEVTNGEGNDYSEIFAGNSNGNAVQARTANGDIRSRLRLDEDGFTLGVNDRSQSSLGYNGSLKAHVAGDTLSVWQDGFNTFNIGKAERKVTNIHAQNIYAATIHGALDGVIPSPGASTTPAVGSIFLVYITANTSTSAMGVGESITTTVGVDNFTLNKAELSLGAGGAVTASFESATGIVGKFTLLSAIDGLSANDHTIALVMRVE